VGRWDGVRVGDPIRLVTPPSTAGVQLADLAKRRGAHRYCDLSNWAPAFAGGITPWQSASLTARFQLAKVVPESTFSTQYGKNAG
jgi:hypothetical protein